MFRKYEKHIFSIVHNWPQPTFFFPDNLATTTFSCRLRDAIASVLEYGWPSPLDVSRLKQIKSEGLEVSIQAEPPAVVAGPRKTRTTEAEAVSETSAPRDELRTYACEVDNPARAVAHSLAILYSKGVLTQPAKITNLDPNTLNEIKNTYGESIGLTQEGNTIIML